MTIDDLDRLKANIEIRREEVRYPPWSVRCTIALDKALVIAPGEGGALAEALSDLLHNLTAITLA